MNILYKSMVFILLIAASIFSINAGGGQIPEYAYIYNLTVQSVKPNSAATFDSHGQITPGIKHTIGSSDIIFDEEGTYLIMFYVMCDSTNSFGLFLNGIPVNGGIYGGDKGLRLSNTGQVIINVKAGSVLTMRSYNPDIKAENRRLVRLIVGSGKDGNKEGVVSASIVILKVD